MSGTMMPIKCHILVAPSDPFKFKKKMFIVLFCPSEDMSPYFSAHDEWLIMKLCVYVGYHDANNVSNVGGDPVTQFNLKKRFIVLFTLFYGHGAS